MTSRSEGLNLPKPPVSFTNGSMFLSVDGTCIHVQKKCILMVSIRHEDTVVTIHDKPPGGSLRWTKLEGDTDEIMYQYKRILEWLGV